MKNFGINLVFFLRESGRQIYRNDKFNDLPKSIKQKVILEFLRIHEGYQVECIPGADLVMHPGGWEMLVKCFCRSWEGYVQMILGAHTCLKNDSVDTCQAITTEALLRYKTDEQLQLETGWGYFETLLNEPSKFYDLVCEANYDYLHDIVADQYDSALPTFALGGGCYGRS